MRLSALPPKDQKFLPLPAEGFFFQKRSACLPAMFDGPIPQDGLPPQRPRKRDAGLAALCIALLSGALVWLPPARQATIFSSASHLRQIEVISDAAVTKFYLHNAGYRLRHPPVLLAALRGAGHWSVTWQGPNDVKILLPRGWSGTVFGQPSGMQVAFLNLP